ncbi:MAG: putative molybdenum carrier protein, partial [Candidatus Thiodiazotropha sp. (ex Ustalcina ferruginea)]|nr:putative molybdenum carrier protein [Candidatus Thiodiazotropha sp. (ex Ustalcina ferruginea)]
DGRGMNRLSKIECLLCLGRINDITRSKTHLEKNRITVLNVAGPRASGEARAYDYTKQVIQQVLKV